MLTAPKIVMTPPTGPGASTHPRRPIAERSVSLRHSPGSRLPRVDRSDSSSDSNTHQDRMKREQARDSPSSLQPFGRGSSGESSNAERWFEKSNNQVHDASASFVDNEPPFFMRNSSSSETPPDLRDQRQQYARANDGAQSLPVQTGLLRLDTEGSSTGDLRSVIDDLTVRNKKLKSKLKKYEKLHDAHLKDQKLFEVRIHDGLPAEKKRELEDTLRKFASGLNGGDVGAVFPPNGYEGIMPSLKARKTASSHTSIYNTDSAYASMSASGQSGNDSRDKNIQPLAASRQQNIHSYLHHIPEGLLPQPNPSTMTERAKKKMVVRRLEQIFAGKGAAGIGHQQPQQQQEVSQLAANADRSALEAQGQRARQEGTREALIMERENDDTRQESPQESNSEQPAVEQRPTRPLDLDPHRAQIPEDNIAYFRHLGFTPPHPEEPKEGHGWIYLNLLVNLAQLHTINVTADFVVKALSECSDKFELSNDGRKVRWRGGRRLTRTSSDSGGASSAHTSDAADGASPRKRPKLSRQESARSGMRSVQQGQGGASQCSRVENNKHVYTPMFFHRDSTEDDDDSSSDEEDDETSFLSPAPVAGNSSGVATGSGFATGPTKRNKPKDDGPIIFYNNAPFCTDLSGERKPQSSWNVPPYTRLATQPVGKPRSTSGRWPEKRGPLAFNSELPEPMDLDDNPIPKALEISFPVNSPLRSPSGPDKKPIPLEVTGIGGVWPADNFAIKVESRHSRVDQQSAPEVPAQCIPKSLPPKFANILQKHNSEGKSRAAVHKQVLASHCEQLPPSALPPALSFMPISDEIMSDDESDEDEEMSLWPGSPGAAAPSVGPQAMNITFDDSEEDEDPDGDDNSDVESDSSLDLLAAAREVDPEAIRAKEREYDANMAERLAEEIPAGSSAATAGGGSGFASPAKGVAREEYERAKQEVRAAAAASRPNLKRAHASDSMQVLGVDASSSSEDGNDDEEEVSSVTS